MFVPFAIMPSTHRNAHVSRLCFSTCKQRWQYGTWNLQGGKGCLPCPPPTMMHTQHSCLPVADRAGTSAQAKHTRGEGTETKQNGSTRNQHGTEACTDAGGRQSEVDSARPCRQPPCAPLCSVKWEPPGARAPQLIWPFLFAFKEDELLFL